MSTLFPLDDRGAVLSDSGTYRYRLWRVWDETAPKLGWVMFNPSVADAEVDDRTIAKCMKYARRDGYGGIVVVNLFAYRAQDPTVLLNALAAGVDVVGPENDFYLYDFAHGQGVERIVAAWGATGQQKAWPRIEAVESLFRLWNCQLHCLAVTDGGQPRHPLYLPDYCKIEAYT